MSNCRQFLLLSRRFSQDFKLTQIKTCLDAVLFFTDYEDKWKAVAAGLPSYSDTWSGNLAPRPDGDGLVFNCTYTLPQFLRAIAFFIATVNALESGSLNQYEDVLNKCINRLQCIHAVTGSGIVGTRIPSGPETDPTVWLKDWYGDTASGEHVQVSLWSGRSLFCGQQHRFICQVP